MFCDYSLDAQTNSDLWLSEIRSDLSKAQKTYSKKYNFCFDEELPGSEPFLAWHISDKEPLGVGKPKRSLFPSFPADSLLDSNIKITLKQRN